jgi:hypothetical protein
MAEGADGQKTGDEAADKAAADAKVKAKAAKADTLELTQAELNEIIESRLARERAIFARKAGTNPDDAAELEQLRKDRQERARKDEEAKGNYERALATVRDEADVKLKAKEAEADRVLAELKTDRIDKSLIAAAAKANAIKPEQVAALLAGRVTLDEAHQVQVLDEHGKPHYTSGRATTVEELVRTFLDGEAHLVRPAQASGGGGSRGGASTSEAGAKPGSPEVQRLRAELEAAEKDVRDAGPAANSRQLQKVLHVSAALRKAEAATKAA